MLKQSDILNLYDKYDVAASKRYGQNFLIDHNILNKIIDVSNISGKDVIEVGPGLGSLTLPLLESAKSVTSYEIDDDMIRVLKGEIASPRFHLVEGDFLKASFNWEGKRTIVANIPYYITTDILFKIFENIDKFDKAVLMVQEEVADRITATVGSSEYGKLSVTASYFANVKKEISVSPSCFLPAPKVSSAVISLTFKDINFANSRKFTDFVKNCFAQRRKTLYNNLKLIIGPEKSKSILIKNGFKESIRPQELSLNDYILIFNDVE